MSSNWITETVDYHGNTRVVALELDDGTRLENFETVLVNEYGDRATFEVLPGSKTMTWFNWGPYDLEVALRRSSIQRLFDDEGLVISE